jgi:hypothetical protein
MKMRGDEAEKNRREAITKSQLNEPPSDITKREVSEDEVDRELSDLTVQVRNYILICDKSCLIGQPMNN